MVGVTEHEQACAWVKQYFDGNEDAGMELGAYIQDILRRRFRALGMPAQEINDLVQDCVVTVFADLHRFDPAKGSLESWLSGFARNAARTWWRSIYNAQAQVLDYDSVPLADRLIEPEVCVSGDLEEALTCLNPIDQELLHMRFGLGHSFDEIAVSANLTPANARKRVSRAVETLRNHPGLRQYFSF